MRLPLTGLALLATALLLFGCQSSPERGDARNDAASAREARTVEVIATDFAFEPATITAAPGEPLAVRLVNQGSAPHNIEFELPSGEVEFEEPVASGAAKTLRFSAPDQPGTYTVYCPVGNHRARGMTGKLVVQR